jgi:hypothetical protein
MAWDLSVIHFPAFRNIFSFLKKKEKGYLLQSGLKSIGIDYL